MRSMLISLLLLVMIYSLPSNACPEGYESFQKNVHAKVRKDCARCHDGQNSQAPAFASQDAKSSYESILSYMNFTDKAQSLFVIRAGNGHCAMKNCNEASGAEMLELTTKWWGEGENLCFRNGKYFTQEVSLPEYLPADQNSYKVVNVPLDKVNADLAGMSFQFKIQNFQNEGDGTKGAYRIRAPRLINGSGAVKIKDVKILLNGKYDEVYNAYSIIDQTATFVPLTRVQEKSATPVLSSQHLIISKDSLEDKKISVSFMAIEKSAETECANLTKFNSTVMPLFQKMNCISCHSDGAVELPLLVFDMTTPADHLCRVTTELGKQKYKRVSPLINYVSSEHAFHESLPQEEREQFSDAIQSWLTN